MRTCELGKWLPENHTKERNHLRLGKIEDWNSYNLLSIATGNGWKTIRTYHFQTWLERLIVGSLGRKLPKTPCFHWTLNGKLVETLGVRRDSFSGHGSVETTSRSNGLVIEKHDGRRRNLIVSEPMYRDPCLQYRN